jgi:hypothetical protein
VGILQTCQRDRRNFMLAQETNSMRKKEIILSKIEGEEELSALGSVSNSISSFTGSLSSTNGSWDDREQVLIDLF